MVLWADVSGGRQCVDPGAEQRLDGKGPWNEASERQGRAWRPRVQSGRAQNSGNAKGSIMHVKLFYTKWSHKLFCRCLGKWHCYRGIHRRNVLNTENSFNNIFQCDLVNILVPSKCTSSNWLNLHSEPDLESFFVICRNVPGFLMRETLGFASAAHRQNLCCL